MSKILLTGGTGYIASHTAVILIQHGHTVVLLDDFSNSSSLVSERLEKITGVTSKLVEANVLDTEKVCNVLAENDIDLVIHFAAFKAVGESVSSPLKYYHNNVTGLLSLLRAMQQVNLNKLILSSSATVYGENAIPPMKESAPLSATNPYGQTKVMMEQIALDLAIANPKFKYGMLRYFNPVGAHHSGLIGEFSVGIPNNLMPYIQQVAIRAREFLSVFGGDYNTIDGTGERDYIHVMDLAKGHALAAEHLLLGKESFTVNLGTGSPVSVLQMIAAFERMSGVSIPYKIVKRRSGDVASVYADTTVAKSLLGFYTEFNLDDMCRDAWHWQKSNPNGYGEKTS